VCVKKCHKITLSDPLVPVLYILSLLSLLSLLFSILFFSFTFLHFYILGRRRERIEKRIGGLKVKPLNVKKIEVKIFFTFLKFFTLTHRDKDTTESI